MKIVIAPDSFKESADAVTVAEAIARGVRRAAPGATVDVCPMADGGQGTVAALVAATAGSVHTVAVRGPLGEPVEAAFGLLGEKVHGAAAAEQGSPRTAVVEMAAASGLVLVPPAQRNPLLTTTYGTGQLIRAALDCGVAKIIVGIGGSATNDGGCGMAQAVGVRFLDEAGRALPDGIGGGQIGLIATIDASRRDPRLGRAPAGSQGSALPGGSRRTPVEIVAACDVTNPLTGPHGASAVYGPQKGATPEMVAALDANLAHLARLIERDLGVRIEQLPGSGAAGGLGGSLVAFCGASLQSGIRIVIEATGLAERIADADLVITGEGRLDGQSLFGKTAIGVGRLAKSLGVPAVAIVGSVGPGAEAALDDCLAAYHPIKPDSMSLAEAFARVVPLLEQAAEQTVAEILGVR